MIHATIEAISVRDGSKVTLCDADVTLGAALECFAGISSVSLPSRERPESNWMVVAHLDGTYAVVDAPVISSVGVELRPTPPGRQLFRYTFSHGRQTDQLFLLMVIVRGMCRAYPRLCSAQAQNWLAGHSYL